MTSTGSLFQFPLENSITGAADEYWTGLNITWATGDNCGNWQVGALNNGMVGTGNSTGTAAISDGSIGCTLGSRPILCVEQP